MPFPKGQKMSEEHKAKISAAQTGKRRGPMSDEARANLSDALTGRKLSAEHRAKIGTAGVGRTHSEESRQKMSASQRKAWDNPERRAEHSATMSEAYADPELRAELSARTTAQWADPEYRARGLAQLARLHDSWLKSPEGVAASRLGLSRMGTWALVGEQLRERDGDLCQLCLDPVDFSLPIDTLMSRSVDHIVPRRAGGTDELDNLWIAHRTCNMKKGARYAGRPDGTKDIRK